MFFVSHVSILSISCLLGFLFPPVPKIMSLVRALLPEYTQDWRAHKYKRVVRLLSFMSEDSQQPGASAL